jgi:hypothetical protein
MEAFDSPKKAHYRSEVEEDYLAHELGPIIGTAAK